MSEGSVNDEGSDFGSADRTPPSSSNVPNVRVPVIDPIVLVYGAWASGTVIFALSVDVSALRMSRRLKKHRRAFGNEGRIGVYVSDEVKTPCLYGLFPAIYIPEKRTFVPGLASAPIKERLLRLALR